MVKKKGQAAMEYIAIVGVSLLIISVGAYFFFSYKDMNDEDISQKRLEDISNDLRQFASESYYSTGAYKKTVDIDLPAEVSKVYVQDQYYLVFEYADGQQQTYEFDTPIFTQVDPLMTGKLVIERVGDITVICSSDPCQCDEVEDCTNLLDDDCDGYTDGADTDCCADADNDTFTAIDPANPLCDGSSLASDCNDNNANINPKANERCEAVDYDCDGQLFNDDCCDFSCYLEEEAEMDGISECREGFEAVLSLSGIMHAHAQDPATNTDYKYDICCNKKEDTGVNFTCSIVEGQTCPGYDEKVFGFKKNAEGGSHVENATAMMLPDSVCCGVEDTAGLVDCNMKSSCSNDEACIASISNLQGQNSELAKCGTYAKQICCKRASATCGSLNKECDTWNDGFGGYLNCGAVDAHLNCDCEDGTYVCNTDYIDCDGDKDCECYNATGMNRACTGNSCVCMDGFNDCDGNPDNGCETNGDCCDHGTCDNKCGSYVDDCGDTINCPGCSSDKICINNECKTPVCTGVVAESENPSCPGSYPTKVKVLGDGYGAYTKYCMSSESWNDPAYGSWSMTGQIPIGCTCVYEYAGTCRYWECEEKFYKDGSLVGTQVCAACNIYGGSGHNCNDKIRWSLLSYSAPNYNNRRSIRGSSMAICCKYT